MLLLLQLIAFDLSVFLLKSLEFIIQNHLSRTGQYTPQWMKAKMANPEIFSQRK